MQTVEVGGDSGVSGVPSMMPDLIEAIGRRDFGDRLMGLLASLCEASCCALVDWTPKGPRGILALSLDGSDSAKRPLSLYMLRSCWRSDMAMSAALKAAAEHGSSWQYCQIEGLSEHMAWARLYANAGIAERMVICGRTTGGFLALSVLRSRSKGLLGDPLISEMKSLAPMLSAVLARHVELIGHSDPALSLECLSAIEAVFHSAGPIISRREADVCARILFGMTTGGIAVDLDVSEETIMTYRKRAYKRLGISCQRELLVWYLNVCDRPH